MVHVGKEAARFAAWANSQRLDALKRIIPKKILTQTLEHCNCGTHLCSRTPANFMLVFVVAMGLCSSEPYRQICRWLASYAKGCVPGRSTLCEARKRLGGRPLAWLAKKVIKLLASPGKNPEAFYAGLRLMAIDGFSLNTADTPANEKAFGRPVNGRSKGAFPQAQVLALVEAGTHVFYRWIIKGCHLDEGRMVPGLIHYLTSDMLLLWDRGFASFDLVKQVAASGAQLLARWKNNRILRPIKKLGDGSFLCYIYASEEDRRRHKGGIKVRIIEYLLNDPTRAGHGEKHRLLTTLLDEKLHPARTLIELYHVRWEEELAINELKTRVMERAVLRSQIPAGVVQEIYGLLLGHYVIRTLMMEAAEKAGVSVLRISFTGTLKVLRVRLPECPEDIDARKAWLKNLISEIQEERIPPRRNRINPRVIKRPQSKWKKKRAHHRNPVQPTKPFHDSIEVLR